MPSDQYSPNDYFRSINVQRSKLFVLIIFIICIITFFIDPYILDLSQYDNRLLEYSHLVISVASIATYFYVKISSSDKRSNFVLYIYLFILTAIETSVSGALDTPTDRGPLLYIATIFTISFVFIYNYKLSTLWLVPNYILFVVLVLLSHTNSNQMLSSIGNGTIFTIIIFGMKIFTYRQKKKEFENQVLVMDYILKQKKKPRKGSTVDTFVVNGELSAKFKECIIDQKEYLDKEFTITKASSLIGTNTSYLSQCINQEYNKNFSALINDFRVDEAIKLMNHKLGQVITIEAISEQSGFKSKSSFYNAFKSKTGMTPTEYLKYTSKK